MTRSLDDSWLPLTLHVVVVTVAGTLTAVGMVTMIAILVAITLDIVVRTQRRP